MSVVQAYGGAINNNEGKKVIFNSPETVAAITFLADIFTNAKYKNMLPPGVEGWTDPSNNEAWLAGTLGITQNAYTLYAQVQRDKNPVYDKTAIVAGCRLAPARIRSSRCRRTSYFVIFKGAKERGPGEGNGEVSHRLALPSLTISKASGGLNQPAYKRIWDTDPFYTNGDPSFPALRQLIQAPLPIKSKTGFTFPQTRRREQNAVQSQYILSDMMGDIILKGTKVQDAVKAAHDRMVQLFEQLGLKQ